MTDDARDLLAEQFETHRPRLRAVAYRMLGSVDEADDALQETWLRLNRSDAEAIDNLGGWLTTVTARICLDMLRSRRARHEDPMGVHVPEPIISSAATGDRKRTRLNSSHDQISYAVFCLKKKKK